LLTLFSSILNHHTLYMSKKKEKTDEKMVAFSCRIRESLYNKLQRKAESEKRSINKQNELILERALS
jgi:hypothetical protein